MGTPANRAMWHPHLDIEQWTALEPEQLEAVERMRAAYLALGRYFVLQRVDR